jgi:dipeptidyl-peptidase-4
VQDLSTYQIRQLTHTDSPHIINGTFDWVYEEEFALYDGFRWSPDSKKIAFWQLDTEGVDDYYLVNNVAGLYQQLTKFKYPKVGRPNAACRIGVVRVDGDAAIRWLDLPGDARQHYIPWMDWAGTSEEILVQQLNRLQNTNNVMRVNLGDDKAREVLIERDKAWLDVHADLHWLDGGKQFTWISERDGWKHVYLVSRDGSQTKLLTKDAMDIIEVVGIDEKAGWLYFTASPDNATQQYLYAARLDGTKTQRVTPPGTKGTHAYQLSPDGRWAIRTFSTFDTPPVIDLVQLPEHKVVRTLVDNSKVLAKVKALKRQPTEFFSIAIGNGVELDAWCMKPADFDANKRYPVLFHVYGEPAGQTVLDRWGGSTYLWHLCLTQQGYLVMSVDNRGTPAPRGREWRKVVYRQVGILAPKEQALAVKAILARWSFLDPPRIGIWGWSGGGSMSLNAIFRYPELYHTAMAVAPVSNQRYYDTIYQERYMGLPEDNVVGYRDGSPLTYAHQLKGHLLLVHGTGDDNVHYANTEAVINELIAHNKQFAMMAYPNRSHSIAEGPNTRRHLFTLLTRYLQEHLPAGPRPK